MYVSFFRYFRRLIHRPLSPPALSPNEYLYIYVPSLQIVKTSRKHQQMLIAPGRMREYIPLILPSDFSVDLDLRKELIVKKGKPHARGQRQICSLSCRVHSTQRFNASCLHSIHVTGSVFKPLPQVFNNPEKRLHLSDLQKF